MSLCCFCLPGIHSHSWEILLSVTSGNHSSLDRIDFTSQFGDGHWPWPGLTIQYSPQGILLPSVVNCCNSYTDQWYLVWMVPPYMWCFVYCITCSTIQSCSDPGQLKQSTPWPQTGKGKWPTSGQWEVIALHKRVSLRVMPTTADKRAQRQRGIMHHVNSLIPKLWNCISRGIYQLYYLILVERDSPP